MKNKKSQSLLMWLLWHPFKFALISLALIMLTSILVNYNQFGGYWPTFFVIIISVAVAAAITLYTAPRGKMNRFAFVALNNTQMTVVATLFLISSIFIAKYQNQISAKLIWLYSTNPTTFSVIVIIAGLFYMYLCGLFFTNLYAKYKRCREMGIRPWKIICSMPFGFGLLWIPGYLIKDDTKNTDTAVSVHTKWYSKLTNRIISNQTYTILTFAVITLYSQFFYGYKSVILTLCSALIFALWFRITGPLEFKQQLRDKYTYVAIIANILVLIGVIVMFINAQNDVANITMNINDLATVQQ